MIFNRWFWFSVLGSIVFQTIHWTPAVADTELTFPEPQHADWICYHAGSSIRTYGREPAVQETILGESFVRWASGFEARLDRSMPN